MNSKLPQQPDRKNDLEHGDALQDTQLRYTRMAPVYDELLDKVESQYKGFLIRHNLISQAEGNVLEVGVGTSRNLVYYTQPKVKSVTLADNTQAMLDTALVKHADLYRILAVPGQLITSEDNTKAIVRAPHMIDVFPPTIREHFSNIESMRALTELTITDSEENPTPVAGTNGFLWQSGVVRANALPTAFLRADSHDLSAIASDSFDTVVDTFGLCSYQDPVRVLQEMQRVCKDGGKILLLEHGLGDGVVVNTMIKMTNEAHKKQWGCDRSKDIEKIVRDSGLIIQKFKREHKGSTYVVIAKPNKSLKQ